MAPLHLAIVAPRFWPLIGDNSLHMLRLGHALMDAGHLVTVVTPRWKKDWPEQMNLGPLPLVRLAGDGLGGLRTIRWMYALAGWLRVNKPAAVLVSGLKHEAYAALGRTVAGQRNTLLIASEDCLPWQRTAVLGSRVAARCRDAPRIVAPSAFLAGQLAESGYAAEQIAVVPRGAVASPAADDSSRQAARAALAAVNYDLATTENACVALACGHLDPRHRFSDLVRAWRIVTARRSESRLWMVGDGPERERLYLQIGDLDQRFRAFLPGTFETHQELLAASNLLLVPGAHEVPPLVMLDALAAGVPVIAADSPAAREYIARLASGFTYPLGDAKALAEAILAIAERPKLPAIAAPSATLPTPASEAAAYLSLLQQ